MTFGLVGFGLGSSRSTASTEDHDLRFVAKTTQFSAIDLPPTGFGQGDQVVFHDTLWQGNTLIGHDGGNCTATFVTKSHPSQFNCVVTFQLTGGQITTQGLINISNPSSFVGRLAVTGGTDAWETARGEGTVHQTSTNLATITLSVITR
jgi:hypothetical protein